MSLSDSLDKLDAAQAAAGLPVSRKRYSAEALEPLNEVFNKEVSAEILSHGYPAGLVVPWAAEDFELYDVEEIPLRQAGYRTEAKTGTVSPDWPKELYVLAEASANPFAIDSRGAIRFARHGMGGWRFEQVAPDLSTFLDVIAEWLSFFVVENDLNIMNDNFEIRPEKRDEIRDRVFAGLSDNEKASFMKALGI